jgi:hypothetical protein
MYEGVKDVLSRYRSGKLPKAFKVIPKLKNWEQVLYLTGKLLLFYNLIKFIIFENIIILFRIEGILKF